MTPEDDLGRIKGDLKQYRDPKRWLVVGSRHGKDCLYAKGDTEAEALNLAKSGVPRYPVDKFGPAVEVHRWEFKAIPPDSESE